MKRGRQLRPRPDSGPSRTERRCSPGGATTARTAQHALALETGCRQCAYHTSQAAHRSEVLSDSKPHERIRSVPPKNEDTAFSSRTSRVCGSIANEATSGDKKNLTIVQLIIFFRAKAREAMVLESIEWNWNKKGHPMTVNAMLECVTELATAAQRLAIANSHSNESTALLLLRTAVRQMSVPIRKLCLDGQARLLQGVVLDPQFLSVGGEKGKYSKAILKRRTERQEWVLEFEGGRREQVVVPESEHEIKIGRLYGIEFQEDGWCKITSPFDVSGSPISMDKWLEMKILQVNSVGYTVRDALKLVADFEGAHANTHQLPAIMAVGVKPDDIDRGAGKRYRMANCIHFGCLSYVQLVVIYSGLYIIRMMQELVTNNDPRKDGVDISGVAGLISPVRTDLSARSRIVDRCHEMIVVGKSNVPGAERQPTVYRIWSGSDDWDRPVAMSDA